MKRKIFCFILAAVMAMSLIGCTTSGNKSNTDKASDVGAEDNVSKETTDVVVETDGEQIEIRFAWWGDTERNEVYNEICDRFEEANPGITVVREPNSWADYWDKLATQMAGGNAPDIFGMNPYYVSDYAGRDALADIQTYIDNGIIDVSNMSEAVVEGGKVNGTMYMISQGITFTNQVVNTSLLEKYSGTVPAFDTDFTWDEFKAQGEEVIAAANAAGDEIYWCSDYSGRGIAFRYFAREAGGDLYTEDGQLGYTVETVEEWFTYWQSMRDAGLVPDGATTTEDSTAALEQRLFTQGNVCYISSPANQLHLYQNQMTDVALSCARFPTGNDGSRGEFIEGSHFTIANSSSDQRKEAAAKLINFFVNTKDSIEIFKMEQGVPANTEMAEYVKILLDDTMKTEIDYINETIKVAGEATYPPLGTTEIDSAFSDAAATVFFNEATPAEAAESFMKTAQSVLDKNK